MTRKNKTAAAQISEMDANAEAALAGIKTATAAAPTVDIKAAAARVNAAVMGIMAAERNVSAARMEEIPHVQTVKTELAEMGKLWTKATTTETVKAEIRGNFPAFANGCRSASEAIYWTLNMAGLSNATAKNLLAVCDKETLVSLVKDGLDGVHIPLTAAYRLATAADMDDSDFAAAAAAGITVQSVGAWIDQRNAAKTVRAQYGAYIAAKAAKEEAAARVAWTNAAGAFAKATTPPWHDMVKTLDSNVHDAMRDEMNRRRDAAQEEAKAAQNKAATLDKTAAATLATAEAASKDFQEAKAAREAATIKAKELQEAADKKHAEMEAAGKAATDAMRDDLARLTREAAAAVKAAEEAKAAEEEAAAAARKQAAAAEAAKDKAALAHKAAAAKTETAAAATVESGGRPTGATFPELLAAYKALDGKRLQSEIAEIAAELTKAKKLAHWAAAGRAIALDLFE